jgi:hypothetical protein
MPTLPVQKKPTAYCTLEELQQRKNELSVELQKDNEQFNTLWNQLFVKRKDSSKGEFISSIIANSITAVDAFLVVRKLMKNYGGLFKKKKK